MARQQQLDASATSGTRPSRAIRRRRRNPDVALDWLEREWPECRDTPDGIVWRPDAWGYEEYEPEEHGDGYIYRPPDLEFERLWARLNTARQRPLVHPRVVPRCRSHPQTRRRGAGRPAGRRRTTRTRAGPSSDSDPSEPPRHPTAARREPVAA
jgi:hypothetical protein